MPQARLLVRHALRGSRAPTLARFRLVAASAAGLAVAAGGCFYQNDGASPPDRGFYYPTGLAISPGRTTLYVANSDFDLQFNGGTVQVLDLVGIRSGLGQMLAGIRCSEGTASACADPKLAGVIGLSAVCNAIQMSGGSGKTNDACEVASDCASGICGPSATCQPCKAATDCAGGADANCPGTCLPNGACALACNQNQILTPAACTPLAPPVKSVATVGAFASGAVITRNPASAGARLFVPVRGDPSITWFDIPDDGANLKAAKCTPVGQAPTPGADCCTGFIASGGACGFQLDCGQSTTDTRCHDEHRLGVDPYDNYRDLTIPVEPVGLDVSSDGTDIVTAHQIAGTPAIGLSQNPVGAACPPPPGGMAVTIPSFQFYLTGSVAAGPTEVSHVPAPAIIAASAKVPLPGMATATAIPYQQGFLVSYNAAPEIDLFRVTNDCESSPPRPFLTRAGQTPVTVNADGRDSRGIAVDPSERQACEATCDATTATYFPCLRACTDTPVRVYIANRSPPSLLLGRVRTTVVDSDLAAGTGSGAFDVLEIYDQVPVSVGPSKVVLGQAIVPDGSPTGRLKTFVFVVSFDTRFVFMYDPEAQTVLPPIRTGRGPHSIAFDACTTDCTQGDTPHAYLYVGHFTDSYIGVVDLDMRYPTFGTMFASLGEPLPPLESK